MKTHWKVRLIMALALLLACSMPRRAAAQAQQSDADTSPASALASALSAACRADHNDFANYLTTDSAAAFRTIPDTQRTAFLRRFSLIDDAGRPLLSSSDTNHVVLRCEAPQVTVEFRFGDTRMRDNLAFIPVEVTKGERTEFGLVREGGKWRLLSLGLVLLDVPQLSKEWAQEAAQEARAAQQNAVLDALHGLSDAIETYRRAFGMLPDGLANLGPAPKDGISPDRANLVGQELANGRASGYEFRYATVAPQGNGSEAHFEIAAIPQTYGRTGMNSFFLDGDGKIHAADHEGEAASADDPVYDPAHGVQPAPYSSSTSEAPGASFVEPR